MANLKPCLVALVGCGLLVLSHASMDGKEYVFSYEGQMKHIASEMPTQNPGLAFRSEVRLQKVDKYNYALKIEGLEIAFVNSRDPKIWQTGNGLNYEKNSKLSSMVERPFIVQYAENNAELGGRKFHQLEVPALDPLWSLNLKKALTSFANAFLPTRDVHTYVSQETTIFGDCNAYWSVEHNPHWSNPSAKVINLTRIINFDECVKVPYKVYGSLKATACTTCEETRTHPLESMSRTSYSFVSASGNRSDVRLEEAIGFSKIEHAPYTENGNTVKLLTEQELRFKSMKDIGEKLEIAGDREVHQSLNMDLIKDPSLRRKLNMKAAENFVEDWGFEVSGKHALSAMQQLADKDFSEEQQRHGAFDGNSSSLLFNEAVTSLNCLNYEQTKEIFDKLVTPAPEEKKLKVQKLFVELTAAAGHNAGILLLIEKFNSGEIDTRFVETFLDGLHEGMSDITEVALNTVLDFCKSDLMLKFNQERNKCLLIYSSMMSEACRFPNAAPQFNNADCLSGELQKKAFQELIPAYETAKQDIDQFGVYINVAANLGTREAAELLLKVLKDQTVGSLAKLNAAHGLMKIVPKHRDIIQREAMAIYMDRQEATDIRIVSSILVFKSKPALSLLQVLAGRLLREPNDQVRSYVVSMIKEIDSSDYPCFRGLRQSVRYIAPLIASKLPSDWKRKDFLTSHMKVSSTYDAKFDQGSHSKYSIVMGDSYVPREMSFSFGQYFANFIFESVNIAVRQQGMDSLADYVLSPRSMGTTLGSNLWSVAGNRRLTRNTESVKQKMNQIDSTMNIKTKKYDPKRLELTIGAFGHTLEVVSLNETHLASFMAPEYVPGTLLNHLLSTDKDEVHHSNLRDFTLVMPSSFGLPFWIDVKMPTAMWHKREKSSFGMDKSGTAKLKLNQHIVVDTTLVETVGIDVPGFGRYLGVGFDKNLKINVPLNVDVDWNIPSGKLTFNEDFSLPRDFFQYSFVPHTSIAGGESSWSVAQLDLFKEEELEKFEKVLSTGGATIRLKGKTLPNDPFSPKHILSWIFDHQLGQKLTELGCNPQWIPRQLRISFEQPEKTVLKGHTLSIKHKMTAPIYPEKPKSLFTEHKEDLANSFTHVVQITKLLRGDSDKQSDLELRYSYTPKRDEQWLHIFYAGKLFGSEQKKMCWVSKMHRTATDWSKRSAEEIDKINADQKIQILTDINVGQECDAKSTIHINMTYEHSHEQKEWLNELKTGTSKTRVHGMENPYIKNYQHCVKWLSKGLVLPIACHKFMVHTSQLNQLTLEISGADSMKLEDSPFITGAPAFMTSKLGHYLSSLQHLPSPRNKISIKSVVHEPCIDQRVADVDLEALHYKLRFDNLPVSWGAHWAPRTATHMGATNLQSYSRKWYNRYCDHQRNGVRTFDRVFYDVPDTTCWKILAEDCSEQKIFTLLTKSSNSSGDKDIKLLLNTHEIEITYSGADIQLKIDGALQDKLKEQEPKAVKNERGNLEFVVLHTGPVLIINAPVYGLYLVSHTSSVFVQAAPFYRGKLCGLCGNFDLNGQNDFRTSDGCYHHTPWSFAQNFVIPDGQCTVPAKANETEKSNCV